jgi:hypothetical protein
VGESSSWAVAAMQEGLLSSVLFGKELWFLPTSIL